MFLFLKTLHKEKKVEKVKKFHNVGEGLSCKQGLDFVACPEQSYRVVTGISCNTEFGFTKMFGLLK